VHERAGSSVATIARHRALAEALGSAGDAPMTTG
jgi:hypothetical protein